MMMPQVPIIPLLNQQTITLQFFNDKDLLEQESNCFVNVLFSDSLNKDKDIIIKGKYGMTIKELLNEYIEQTYGDYNYNYIFLYDARKLDRHDKRKIEQVFRSSIAKVQVFS